ncbi:lysozyme [Novosphingobium rosa]|uniref:lysozyme n=1 Tax=Novosphingobium rosa TaxID=76978 RepID=UPI00082D1847|nr:lysozyme [Novosphingobium rosa]
MADAAQNADTSTKGLGRKTLAAIVGGPTALLLLTQIPAEESGRKVAVTIAPSGQATIKHVSGPQYLRTYLDMVGVATACDGLTGEGIKIGKSFTEAQCSIMLEARLADTASHVMDCTPGLALTLPRRDNARFAAVSLAYNIGWPTYCRSTMRAQLNAGRIGPACDALTLFNKAGGRVVAGLVSRRGRERAYCVKDVA